MENRSDVKIVRPVSDDVHSDKSFHDLALTPAMIAALATCGFERPSPVQEAAIPLGRVGSDLIVQAKSGTGKTAVFAIVCLERLKPEAPTLQALIVSPTREIAIQSEQVISRLAAALPEPRASSAVFIGGLPTIDDEKRLRRLCHIAVGTPGRLCQLLQAGSLQTDGITMFVLDEADALLGESLYADVTWIYDLLPRRKQVMALSATYTPALLEDLEPLMKRPQRVMLCEDSVALHAVSQFYCVLRPGALMAAGVNGAQDQPPALEPDAGTAQHSMDGTHAVFQAKVGRLVELLASVPFHQAAVFCNQKPQAEWLARRLSAAGYPAAYLAADRAQTDRMDAMDAVRGFKLRVIVSTDVMARGVDLARVNLVVNLDLPREAATYMHRVGRTGRFGSRGICVSFVTDLELVELNKYVEQAQGGTVLPLPDGPQLMHLMEQDLSSEWERQALQDLSAAPRSEPPPPLEQEKKAAEATSQAEAVDGHGAVEQQQQQQWEGASQEDLDAAWQVYWEQCYSSYYGGSSHGGWGGSSQPPHQQQPGYTGYSWDPYGYGQYSDYYSQHSSSPPWDQHPSYSWYGAHSQQPCGASSHGGHQRPRAQPSQEAKQASEGTGGAAACQHAIGASTASGAAGGIERERVRRAGEAREGHLEAEELSDEVLRGKAVGGVEEDGAVEDEEAEGPDEGAGSSDEGSDVPKDEELDGYAASLLDKLDVRLPDQQPQPPLQPTEQAPHAQAGVSNHQDGCAVPASQPGLPTCHAAHEGGTCSSRPRRPWPPYGRSNPWSSAWNSSQGYSMYPGPGGGPYESWGPSWQGSGHGSPVYGGYSNQSSSSPYGMPAPPCFSPPPLSACQRSGGPVRCPACTLLSFQAEYNSWVAHYSHWYTQYYSWYTQEVAEMEAEERQAAAHAGVQR